MIAANEVSEITLGCALSIPAIILPFNEAPVHGVNISKGLLQIPSLLSAQRKYSAMVHEPLDDWAIFSGDLLATMCRRLFSYAGKVMVRNLLYF